MLTRSEIFQLVNDYIGVSQGYLGDFTYRTHHEFYPYYCDLDIDPHEFEGTTRERFIYILETSEPSTQARILRGILAKYPANSEVPLGASAKRTDKRYEEIQSWINRLESSPIVQAKLTFNNETVDRAIRDLQILIKENGTISGVDRIHTVLHGYLKNVCDSAGISYDRNANLPALFSVLRRDHPAFQTAVVSEETTRILRSMGAIIESFNPVRNQASLAHPNSQLIDEPEATLMINTAQTLLQYIEAKLNNHARLETYKSWYITSWHLGSTIIPNVYNKLLGSNGRLPYPRYIAENEGYIANISNLEACSLRGTTLVEALREVEWTEGVWLEAAQVRGKPIPALKHRLAIYHITGS